jgi:hypothetical protein
MVDRKVEVGRLTADKKCAAPLNKSYEWNLPLAPKCQPHTRVVAAASSVLQIALVACVWASRVRVWASRVRARWGYVEKSKGLRKMLVRDDLPGCVEESQDGREYKHVPAKQNTTDRGIMVGKYKSCCLLARHEVVIKRFKAVAHRCCCSIPVVLTRGTAAAFLNPQGQTQ